jgi:endonuclease/exonuclease/phosphatase family metal-dependent hydrolase
MMRIATFNLENLFTRPNAMSNAAGAVGQQAIDDHAELNAIVARSVYSDSDKARLLELDLRYRFSAPIAPDGALIVLQKIRGQLYTREGGALRISAEGRGVWTGWFELTRMDVGWNATANTGRVVHETNADILICVEVENRPTLERFNEQVLAAQFGRPFEHVMVIDGNDRRGIDVGVMSRYPIVGVRSHVDDRSDDGVRIFSRDCPEYGIRLPNGELLIVIPNHFKSKRGGNDEKAQALRLAQARRAIEIGTAATAVTRHVLIGGDLNDTPDSDALAPLWSNGFTDVQDHRDYPTDRPGTFDTGTAANKIDYLIMSPALRDTLQTTGIERRGSFHPRTWEPFDTVKSKADEASDHHLVWADFRI